MRLGRAYPASRIVTPPPRYRFAAFDNSAQSANQSGLANNTAFTFGHTVAGDFGIVAVTGNLASTTADLTVPATVSLGGVTLNEVAGGRFANDASTAAFIRVFTGSGIPSGGQTASVTFNQAGTTFSGVATSYTYQNVASIGTMQTAVGTGTSGSVLVPATIGDIVWGFVLRNSTPSGFSSLSFTQRQTLTTGSVMTFAAGDTVAASSPVPISATFSSGAWVTVGLELIGS